MEERNDLVRETEQAYAALRAAIEGLSEDDMRRPWLGTWGVREILVHAAGWHRAMIPALARIRRGESPFPDDVSYDDVDAWNARFVAGKEGVKAADALAELDASHREFVAAGAALGAQDLAPGSAGRELFDGSGAAHYREHTAQISAWRRGQTVGPAG